MDDIFLWVVLFIGSTVLAIDSYGEQSGDAIVQYGLVVMSLVMIALYIGGAL